MAEGWMWRMIVHGSFRDAWVDASDAERGLAFDAWTRAHRAWQDAGCRLILSMDDVLRTGVQPDGAPNFYTAWEIPDPAIVHELLSPFWREDESGVKLSRYFALEAVVGKPIVSMENALGGPQAATAPTAAGDFA